VISQQLSAGHEPPGDARLIQDIRHAPPEALRRAVLSILVLYHSVKELATAQASAVSGELVVWQGRDWIGYSLQVKQVPPSEAAAEMF